MKKTLPFLLLLVFVTSTGASIIDRETKQNVQNLSEKMDRLQKQFHNLHAEVLSQLKKHGEATRKSSPAKETGPDEKAYEEILRQLKGQNAVLQGLVLKIDAWAVQTPPQVVVPQPVTPQAVVPPPPAAAASPAETATASTGGRKVSEESILLALVSLFVLVALLIAKKKRERKIQNMLWKSEGDSVRSDMVVGRPRLKISNSGGRLDLENRGEGTADDIKLLVGHAATSMKQRLKVVSRISAGEKTALDLPTDLSSDTLYATVEYKSPESGRLYKDQFVLTADRTTKREHRQGEKWFPPAAPTTSSSAR